MQGVPPCMRSVALYGDNALYERRLVWGHRFVRAPPCMGNHVFIFIVTFVIVFACVICFIDFVNVFVFDTPSSASSPSSSSSSSTLHLACIRPTSDLHYGITFIHLHPFSFFFAFGIQVVQVVVKGFGSLLVPFWVPLWRRQGAETQ